MSCKPMTKKEWAASVDEMWKSAVEFAYKDLIDEAVKAEREACAKICDEWANSLSGEPEMVEMAKEIRARSNV